jgi:hypothetical protein
MSRRGHYIAPKPAEAPRVRRTIGSMTYRDIKLSYHELAIDKGVECSLTFELEQGFTLTRKLYANAGAREVAGKGEAYTAMTVEAKELIDTKLAHSSA